MHAAISLPLLPQLSTQMSIVKSDPITYYGGTKYCSIGSLYRHFLENKTQDLIEPRLAESVNDGG